MQLLCNSFECLVLETGHHTIAWCVFLYPGLCRHCWWPSQLPEQTQDCLPEPRNCGIEEGRLVVSYRQCSQYLCKSMHRSLNVLFPFKLSNFFIIDLVVVVLQKRGCIWRSHTHLDSNWGSLWVECSSFATKTYGHVMTWGILKFTIQAEFNPIDDCHRNSENATKCIVSKWKCIVCKQYSDRYILITVFMFMYNESA